MAQTYTTPLSTLARTQEWSFMTKKMNGTSFGQAMHQTTYSEIWTNTKSWTIFQEATTLAEKTACTKTSLEWRDDMEMSTIFVLRLMCFHRTFSSLTMIGLWRKIRTQFGFSSLLAQVVDEELNYLQIMKSYQKIRKDFLFQNTSTHLFSLMASNLTCESMF